MGFYGSSANLLKQGHAVALTTRRTGRFGEAQIVIDSLKRGGINTAQHRSEVGGLS
jgi:hypothetical protein